MCFPMIEFSLSFSNALSSHGSMGGRPLVTPRGSEVSGGSVMEFYAALPQVIIQLGREGSAC